MCANTHKTVTRQQELGRKNTHLTLKERYFDL